MVMIWLVILVVMAVIEIITLGLTTVWFVKEQGEEETNAEGLIGKCGIVLEDINNLHAVGLVQVDGMEWSARATDECTIEKGQEVVIRAISGVKLIVEEKKTEG